MKACTISLACEAPVLLTVLVTISAVQGSRGCASPVRGSAPCPHPCLHGAAVRLGLRGSDHRCAVVRHCCLTDSLVEPCDDSTLASRRGGTAVR